MTSKKQTGPQKKEIIRLTAITLAILSVPFLAMIFDWQVQDPGNPVPEQVNWNLADFIAMGSLIFGTGLIYEFLKHRFGTGVYRFMFGIVLLALFCLVWVELSVGLFTDLGD